VHVDVKKLARFARPGHRVFGRRAIGRQGGWDRRVFKLGWEYLHVCVDDASRLGYVELLERARRDGRRLPRARGRLVLALRHHRRRRDDR
jgi:hypothetical protein